MQTDPEKGITPAEANEIWTAIEFLQDILSRTGTLNIEDDEEDD